MHGVIFVEMEKYVDTKFGGDTWNTLLASAGLGAKAYSGTKTYPDEEVIALVSTASKMTGIPIPAILEDFGEFIVPDLAKTYKVLIRPRWKTLDLLENTESIMHRMVRAAYRGATPPILKSSRVSPNEVVITYGSQRKMCALAKGIVKGIAALYAEQVTLTETTCMLKGDHTCTLRISTVRPSQRSWLARLFGRG